MRTSNPNPFKNSQNKIVKDDKIVDVSNNSGQNLTELEKSKIHQNLATSKKSNRHLKSSKKAILDWFEILIHLTVITNASATKYFIFKAKVVFTYLR